jgi:outer membrane protein insertion porin family
MISLSQIIVLATASLLISGPHSPTRSLLLEDNQTSTARSCPRTSDDKEPSGPEILIADVTFSGTLQMPSSDQEEIEASIKALTHGKSLDGVVDDALEGVRAGWQDRGYFNVKVSGDAKTLTSSSLSERIALRVRVVEGLQYTVSGISFTHNNMIPNAALRSLFPIKDGDILRRTQIATGLENLRRAYGEIGFINFTAIPGIKSDDVEKTITLDIEVAEGKQFYISSINFLGLDEAAQQELLRDPLIKVGQVYNGRLYELFIRRHGSMFPSCECRSSEELRMDDKTGLVALTFDFRPCSVDWS